MALPPKHPGDKRGAKPKVKPANEGANPAQNETVRKEQQRQWISDQVMWEAVLGIRDDNAVDNLMGPVETTPPPDKREAQKAKFNIRQHAEQLKQQKHAQRQVQKPRAPSPPAKQPPTLTRPVLKPAQPQIRPTAANKPAAHMSAKPQTKPHRPPPVASTGGHRESDLSKPLVSSSRAQVSQHPARPAPTPQKPAPAPVDPAVFESRELNRNFNIPIQDAHEIRKIQQRAKLRNVAKYLQTVFVKHWPIFSALLFGFILGYLVASPANTQVSDRKMVTKEEIDALIQKAKLTNPQSNVESKSPVKEEPKESAKPKTKPVQQQLQQQQQPQQQNQQEARSSQLQSNPQTSSPAQQFQGRDILLEPTPQNNSVSSANDTLFTDGTMVIEEKPVNPEITNTASPVAEVPVVNAQSATDQNIPAQHQTTMENTVENTVQPLPEQTKSVENTPKTNSLPQVITAEQQAIIDSLEKENIQKFKNHEWEAVIGLSNQIIALNPKVISALINRAVAYTELGMYDLALNDAFLAVELEPNNPLAINNRGYTYEKMGNLQQAINDYAAACGLGVEISCKEVKRLKAKLAEQNSTSAPAVQ